MKEPWIQSLFLYVLTPVLFILACLVIKFCKKVPYWQFRVLAGLGICYMIGKTCGILVVGPRFVRWYLADIGWAFCFAFLPIMNDSVKRMLSQKSIDKGLRLCRFAFIIAIAQELLMLYVQKGKGGKHASGDWMDIFVFVTTYFIAVAILKSLRREFDEEDRALDAIELQEKRTKRKERKERKKKLKTAGSHT